MAVKFVPYVRKSQVGTPMASFINAKSAELTQANPGTYRMRSTSAKGKLKTSWNAVNKKLTGATAVKKRMEKGRGMSRGSARKYQKSLGEVSFKRHGEPDTK